jgi:hypothetical protein
MGKGIKHDKKKEDLSDSDAEEHSQESASEKSEDQNQPWQPSQLFVSGLPYETTE